MAQRTPLVAGNWKMHGTREMAGSLLAEIAADCPSGVDVAVFPPFPYIADTLSSTASEAVAVGAQDVSPHPGQGAYTGEVSAAMLADIGCRMVLVGHSERRQYHAESNVLVAAKFVSARDAGLIPVLCLGESLQEREAGETEQVVGEQLAVVLDKVGSQAFAGAVVAYEPVWAIGTGKTATPGQVDDVHAFLRSQLVEQDVKLAEMTRIVYGGSVKPANAADLFACENVDGGLIGGASLKASDFLTICRAARS